MIDSTWTPCHGLRAANARRGKRSTSVQVSVGLRVQGFCIVPTSEAHVHSKHEGSEYALYGGSPSSERARACSRAEPRAVQVPKPFDVHPGNTTVHRTAPPTGVGA